MKFFLSIFLLLAALSANADKYFSVSGGGDGASWSTPATFSVGALAARGTTNWIADGSYSGFTFNQAASGSTYAYIVKATVSSHGTSTGWSDTMGDGQASFGGIVIVTPYLWLDGQERTESFTWTAPTGYGFKVSELVANANNSDNAEGSVFKYIDCGPTYTTTYSSGWGVPWYFVRQLNVTISHCAVHNYVGTGLQGSGSDGMLVEYCDIGPGWGKEALRGGNLSLSTDWTVRHNRFLNACQTDPDDGTSGITAEIGIWDWDSGTGTGFAIYGNWFFNQYSGGRNAVIVVGGNGGSWAGGAANGTLVYNNTFAGLTDTSGALVILNGTGTEAKNNLVYSAGSGITASTTADNVTASGDPFVDYASRDYRIESASEAHEAGTSLGSPYNVDRWGVSLGDSVGAMSTESGGGGDTTDPTVTITGPTSSTTYSQGSAALTISGTASDNVGVSSVTAAMSGATSGSISITGTTSWSGSTTLNAGETVITVTAVDAAANDATDVLTVTYTVPTAGSATAGTMTATTVTVGGAQ